MIEGKDPVLQAFLGTLMTWGLTALGAAMAFFIRGNQVLFKDYHLNDVNLNLIINIKLKYNGNLVILSLLIFRENY